MQVIRTAPAPIDWRFAIALVSMIAGWCILALLGLLWCFSDSSFGGYVGFGLQICGGGFMGLAGWFGRACGSDE